MLEGKPLSVRKKIAFVTTVIIGVVLIALLVLRYTTAGQRVSNNGTGQLRDFYHTLTGPSPSSSEAK